MSSMADEQAQACAGADARTALQFAACSMFGIDSVLAEAVASPEAPALTAMEFTGFNSAVEDRTRFDEYTVCAQEACQMQLLQGVLSQFLCCAQGWCNSAELRRD